MNTRQAICITVLAIGYVCLLPSGNAATADTEPKKANDDADSLHRQSTYERLVADAKKALELAEAKDPNSITVVMCLNTLGVLYKMQGKYAAAEPVFERALTITERALGPDHPRVALAQASLASVYRVEAKYDLAEPLYKRALAGSEKALGPDHLQVAEVLKQMAIFYADTDRPKEALAAQQRADAIEKTKREPAP